MCSLTANSDVVDADALSPRLIKAHLDRMPFSQATKDEYRRVDGTRVPREQWFHPDKCLLPRPMSEELKERTRKKIEESRMVMGERIDRILRGEFSGCAVVLRSNYDLEPKKKDEE